MNEKLATDTLKYAKTLGATAAEVSIGESKGFSVEVRLGEVETIENNYDKGLVVTVYFGTRSGMASTSSLDSKSISLTVEKACSIAKFTAEDPCAGLADPELMAYDYPDLDLYHPWEITISDAIDLAKKCEAKGLASDKRITNSEGSAVCSYSHFGLYANSHGFIGGYPTTRHSVNLALIAEEGTDKQMDGDFTVARSAKELETIPVLAKRAAKKTVDRLGAKILSTRTCSVLFQAEVAKSLVAAFLAAISGGNLYRESSFLLDYLEKKLFPEFVQISEKPFLPGALGSAPFDSEGVATYCKDFVKDGILKSYILGSYSARKLKMKTTANAGGVHNLIVSSTGQNLKSLLKTMGTGLLVTEIMGQGTNIVTGDYSHGVFGYWVENGIIQYPVHEITIAGNLKDMFNNIQAIGTDIERRGNINTGSILIEGMTVAGQD